MKEIFITEEELEYYSNPALVANEAAVPYEPQMSFEEEVKKHKCITLEEFGRMWKEAIDNDPRFT